MVNRLFDWEQWGAETAQFISNAAHIVGFLGMICVVLAFGLVVSEKWKPTSLAYNLLNGVGAILLMASLFVHFNLGSFVIEIFWIGISLMGIMRYMQSHRTKNDETDD